MSNSDLRRSALLKRRELAGVLIASAAGAALVAKPSEAQTCTAPCFPQTSAEAGAGVTPVNYSYVPGVVDRYGTNTTPGVTNMNAAFAASLAQQQAGGAPMQLLASTYLVSELYSQYRAGEYAHDSAYRSVHLRNQWNCIRRSCDISEYGH
jgi:hypothetical protein